MKKLLLTLALIPGLNGCLTTAVAFGCSGNSLRGPAGSGQHGPAVPRHGGRCSPEVEAVGVAVEIDGEALEAPGEGFREEAFWRRTHVGGVVTSDGAPVHRVRAELLLGDEHLGVVRTDVAGRYDLHVTVDEPSCSELRVVLSHSELGRTGPIPLGCGDTRIDHDFDRTGRARSGR